MVSATSVLGACSEISDIKVESESVEFYDEPVAVATAVGNKFFHSDEEIKDSARTAAANACPRPARAIWQTHSLDFEAIVAGGKTIASLVSALGPRKFTEAVICPN